MLARQQTASVASVPGRIDGDSEPLDPGLNACEASGGTKVRSSSILSPTDYIKTIGIIYIYSRQQDYNNLVLLYNRYESCL
jgi:hypothetical protein